MLFHEPAKELEQRDVVRSGEVLRLEPLENIGELPNVSRGLQDRGWSADDVHQAMGENWLRVYGKVWGG